MIKEIEFLHNYCNFDEEYTAYVLLGVARKKDNQHITNSQEVVFKEVLYQPEHIARKYSRIYNNCKNYVDREGKHLNFYIYMSVNPRDTMKCYWAFMKELMLMGEQLSKDIDKQSQLARLDKRWLSVLMKPQCKKGRGYFMLDVDTKSKKVRKDIRDELFNVDYNTSEITYRETKNGYHIIYKPFNKQKFTDWIIKNEYSDVIGVQTDNLLYLNKIDININEI